jgi:hypothetical protein
VEIIRSTDHGATWSDPVQVGALLAIGAYDPQTHVPIRDGVILASIAVGPDDRLWVAWSDARFSGGSRDGILLAHSGDGGLTWSSPVLVNGQPATQAFTGTINVAADGTLGLTYYDLRNDTADRRTLLATYWLATSPDGVTWTERRISGPFDLAIAPYALGLFVGDYEGLASAGGNFVPFFAQTHPDLADRTNIYAVALPAAVTSIAKSAALAYPARDIAPASLTPEWARRTGEMIEEERHHFPDRSKPRLPPGYLR